MSLGYQSETESIASVILNSNSGANTPRKLKNRKKNRRKSKGRALNHENGTQNVLYRLTAFIISFALDVIFTSLHLLRIPFALLLILGLGYLLFTHATHQFYSYFQIVIAPLCSLPIPIPYITQYCAAPVIDYQRLVDMQVEAFDTLLDESSPTVALDIKKAEMATQDLRTLVKSSDLTSKEVLADGLERFIEGARGVGRDLQKLSARVNGALDLTLAINEHTTKLLDQAAKKTRTWHLILNPVHTEAQIQSAFVSTMLAMDSDFRSIILQATSAIHNLDLLEEHINTIHQLSSHESRLQKYAKVELMSELWTILGGNRARLSIFDENLSLLRSLDTYRQKARSQVVGTLNAVQKFGFELQELRETVARPSLGEGIPPEIQAQAIKIGIERLQESRVRNREREIAETRERLEERSRLGIEG
ncbi:hypothetical protein NEOLI_001731 [Neolecta irregularis DAH-3]|uniref:Uncharacterized protein n=1 Tax=Neolecta irregularis (strain DAH-3) TaxID=1198029 RepID=A0A1U7LP35_NEOID|nr:hypothetical protein NEOLI_001731 [Neolecta irregularis DAH-3]|eukprot:OLL24426.1 hypothetical protein NEOLI_001731 [Neolecta irregularis DAH-3]